MLAPPSPYLLKKNLVQPHLNQSKTKNFQLKSSIELTKMLSKALSCQKKTVQAANCASYKLEQYEKKNSRTMTPENMEGKLNRISMAIEDTKGLSDATGIQKFLARAEEEGVKAPKNKKVVLDVLS